MYRERTDILSVQRLVVEGSWGWFTINLDENIIDDFDNSELDQIRSKINKPSFAQLEYSDEASVNIAVLGLPKKQIIFIDNDHGLCLPIDEIRKRIQKAEVWQTAVS